MLVKKVANKIKVTGRSAQQNVLVKSLKLDVYYFLFTKRLILKCV